MGKDTMRLNEFKEEALERLEKVKQAISQGSFSESVKEAIDNTVKSAEELAQELKAKGKEIVDNGVKAEKVISAVVDTVEQFIKSIELKEEGGKMMFSFEKPDFSGIFSKEKNSQENKKEK